MLGMTTFRFLFFCVYDFRLPLEVQLFNYFFIGRWLLFLQVRQKLAASRNHLQKSAAGMMVFRILLQVRRKFVDLTRNDGYLDLSRTRVLRMLLEFSRDASRYPFGKHGFMIQNLAKKCNFSDQKPLRKLRKFSMLTT